MCTILYHKLLGVLTKNRDKNILIEEEVVQTSEFIAVRTKGSNYYSLGVNKNGCAFASTAVNSVEWTSIAGQGNITEAKKLFEDENHGLVSPTVIISELLPHTTDIKFWIEKLMQSHTYWMGYNVIVADKNQALVVETYADKTHIRKLMDKDVVTNHFLELDHGSKKYQDYPNSYDRLKYVSNLIQSVEELNQLKEIIKPADLSRQKEIWRNNAFYTVSSSILDLNKCVLLYSKGLHDEYKEYK